MGALLTTADWVAWISAGSAAVQALGAVAAIAFSAKLAADAVEREKAAQLSAERRIQETNDQARAQILADRAAAISAREAERIERHNQPLLLAIDLAHKAVASLKRERDRHRRFVAEGDNSHRYITTPGEVSLLQSFGPELIKRAETADASLAILNLMDALAPFAMNAEQGATIVLILDQKINDARFAISRAVPVVRLPPGQEQPSDDRDRTPPPPGQANR